MKFHGTSIGRKLLILVMAGSLMAFLVLGGLSFYGMAEIYEALDDRGKNLGEFAADYTQKFAEYETRRSLSKMTRLKAQEAELEFTQISDFTSMLSKQMTYMLNHPEEYNPRYLPSSYSEVIHSGECYVHHGTALMKNSINERVAGEIALVSNICDSLVPLKEFYSTYRMSFFAGSKNNYMVCMDIVPEGDHVVDMIDDFLVNYNIPERPWFKSAKDAGKLIFTDVYVGIEGYPAISCAAPYYDSQGFAGVVCIDGSIESIYNLLEDKTIGASEASFILDCSTGDVLLSSRKDGALSSIPGIQDLRQSQVKGIVSAAQSMIAGNSAIVELNLDGKEYYLSFAPMNKLGWSYGILLEKAEVMKQSMEARKGVLSQIEDFRGTIGGMFLVLTLKTAVIFLIIISIMYYGSAFLTRRFSKPIQKLSDGVRDIAQGNLDKKLDIQTGDEIEHLAICFNVMTDELKENMEKMARITSERERISTELNVARNIQSGLMPNDFPPFPDRTEFDIFASMNIADEIGGDFYDFYLLDERYLVVTIGDVSGNGIPAALFMLTSKTVLKNFITMMHSPDELSGAVTCANTRLCKNNDEGMFVTLFVGIMDIETGELTYVNGGHEAPMIGRMQSDGSRLFDFIPLKKSCILGAAENRIFPMMKLAFEPGDMLFMYTDGVTEAMNSDGVMYTSEKLKTVLNDAPCKATAEETLGFVKEDILNHVNDKEQPDDAVMLGLVYLGK